ncbi:MAG TPA: FHA domain-containing protein [Thermoanaerobaculia bacterium]|nr:FHA domain-containing protein [Thermoanaerobaculia bacterium]
MIIIECPQCHARYQYDEERFERKPAKKIKCAKCANIFEIKNPAYADIAPPLSPERFERTFTRRDEAKPKQQEDTTEQSPLPEKSTDKMPAELQLPEGKRISLAIIAGPDAGSMYRVEKPRVTIGRSAADVVLNDTEASRVHAAIEVRDFIIQLRDLGSTNGTLIDGQKIADAVELQDKSEFVVGATTLMLIVTEDG